MPEHKDPVEAVQAAAEVVEKLTEDDDKGNKTPTSPGHKIRSLAALIVACASLIATLGTFLKTCDHSLTEHSYNTLSDSITKLSDEQQKNHDDLVALRGYLDGVTHAPLAPGLDAAAPMMAYTTSITVPTSPTSTVKPVTHPVIVAQQPNDGGLITFAILAPPLPTVHTASSSVRPPPFAQIQ